MSPAAEDEPLWPASEAVRRRVRHWVEAEMPVMGSSLNCGPSGEGAR